MERGPSVVRIMSATACGREVCSAKSAGGWGGWVASTFYLADGLTTDLPGCNVSCLSFSTMITFGVDSQHTLSHPLPEQSNAASSACCLATNFPR